MRKLFWTAATLVAALTACVSHPTRIEERKRVDVDPDTFVGRYAFDADDLVAIKNVNGKIVALRTAQPEKTLVAVGANELVNPEDGETYVFDKDSVTVDGVTAKRTRVAPPFDMMLRDPATGIENYKLLDPALATEERLRVRGNALRKQGRTAAAVMLLKLNTEKHPQSAAAWDALAAAQLADGDTAGAAESRKRAEGLK